VAIMVAMKVAIMVAMKVAIMAANTARSDLAVAMANNTGSIDSLNHGRTNLQAGSRYPLYLFS